MNLFQIRLFLESSEQIRLRAFSRFDHREGRIRQNRIGVRGSDLKVHTQMLGIPYLNVDQKSINAISQLTQPLFIEANRINAAD